MKNIILYLICGLIPLISRSQVTYTLSKENIITKPTQLIKLQTQRCYYPVGSFNNSLVYQLNLKKSGRYGFSAEALERIYYDENFKIVIDSMKIKKQGRKILRITQNNDLTLYHGFFVVPNSFEEKTIDELDRGEYLLNYQDFWVDKNGQTFKIESYPEHYYDKTIVTYVDYTGRYITYNKYSGEYLRSDIADSIITIYDFENIVNGKPSKKEITCAECVNVQIVGDNIYYGKKFMYMPGTDFYDFRIYVAPKYDLGKSKLLGEHMEPLLVSPDGKYILAKKDFHGKYTYVVLNTERKMFNYILGRDYFLYPYFYSPAYKKFAFDTQNNIIYIDFPAIYPFRAVDGNHKEDLFTKEQDSLFWQKYTHRPLIEK